MNLRLAVVLGGISFAVVLVAGALGLLSFIPDRIIILLAISFLLFTFIARVQLARSENWGLYRSYD